MQQIVVDAEAGQVSAELAKRGIASNARVHAIVELVSSEPTMAALSEAGRGFDWLDEEPELYSDDDLLKRGQ